ncbi:PREDICTED: conserved oligomeric Golgi complex subunit 6 [Propithecus coquereli]|uniref:conserved oligomeric Golgi complex subunit 6 n=1 Tax=Propithecus coquereli TaxID=379532 RepID=UPI00063FBA45|nr:PREDICTED: conserved oligomeric Golgi complex subunit 6 [Propithecus coquereli]
MRSAHAAAALPPPGRVGSAATGVGTRRAMAEGSGEVVAVPASGAANGLSNGAGGTSAPTNNPLSRKLHKILETRLDNDKEMLEALKALSTFFVENSLRTRRNLRGDIERRSLAINEEFVGIFKEVKEELESINEDVQAMSNCCQDMTNRLQAAKEQTQDLIVKTTKLQSESYVNYFSGECRTLTQESCDISPVLTQAMEALQDRPVLYKYTLDEFGTARRSTVVRGFIDALTRGGPGGTPRPIEMHSHDPLRYVGDMLAWLHQATASEKEHLEALLKHVTTQAIDKHFSPRCGIVGNSATTLLTTIEEMHLLSKKIFFNSLSLHTSKLMDKVELPPPDLGPSSALNQTLTLLREVLASHDSSVVPLDARQADFVQVLSCVLDPLLQMCTVSASNLGTADMATFMVNSLYMMKTTLALFEFTDRRLEMLQFQIEAHLDTLINEQASYVLTRVGLSYIYNTVQQHKPEQGALANMPNLDSVALKAAMVQFDRYLSAPDNLLMPQLNFLLSTTVKEQIVRQSTELVCRAYGEVYAAVTDPANEYKDPESILHRSPQQVQTLLS